MLVRILVAQTIVFVLLFLLASLACVLGKFRGITGKLIVVLWYVWLVSALICGAVTVICVKLLLATK